MTILGKILAILNVLAVLGFMYLAVADWSKRQSWSYAVYRRQLAIDGLPLEAEQRDPAEDIRLVDRQGEVVMDDLKRAAGGQQAVPATQQEELQAVRADVQNKVNGQDGEDKKADLLRLWLQPLARTTPERNELKAMKFDQLQAKFNALFEGALKPAFDANGKPVRDAAGKRQEIAHLLFNLSDTDIWHQRVLTVVGLKAYVQEATAQAAALADMAYNVRLAVTRDRSAFEAANQAVVKEVRTQADYLEGRKAYLATQEKLKLKNDELVTERTKERNQFKAELEKARKETAAALVDQAKFEKALFEAERRLRDAARANEAYERELRSLEQVRR